MKSSLGLFAAIPLTLIFSTSSSLALKMSPEDARKNAMITCSVQEDEDLMISEINLVPLEIMENEIDLSQESFDFIDSSTMGLRFLTMEGVVSDVCETIPDKSSDYRYRCPIGESGVEINGYIEFFIGGKDFSGNEASRAHMHVKNFEKVILHLVSPMTCVRAAQ